MTNSAPTIRASCVLAYGHGSNAPGSTQQLTCLILVDGNRRVAMLLQGKGVTHGKGSCLTSCAVLKLSCLLQLFTCSDPISMPAGLPSPCNHTTKFMHVSNVPAHAKPAVRWHMRRMACSIMLQPAGHMQFRHLPALVGQLVGLCHLQHEHGPLQRSPHQVDTHTPCSLLPPAPPPPLQGNCDERSAGK